MSLSEINGAIKRAISSGLMIGSDLRNQVPQSVPYALQEFIIHGVRYSFPIEKGTRTRGVPTGLVGAKLENAFANGEENDIPVWPYPQGKVRGIGIKPLFRSLPDAVEKEENQELYILLALVDMVREGRARERNLASGVLSKKLELDSSHV